MERSTSLKVDRELVNEAKPEFVAETINLDEVLALYQQGKIKVEL